MAKIKLKGNEIHTTSELPGKGKTAPNFTLVKQDLSRATLENYAGKKKILNIFPSMDTGTCAKSVHKFYELCSARPDLIVLNISMDLPFAASRFCGAEGLKGVQTLSAFNSSFPKDYGIQIVDGPLAGLCARAVIILDEQNKVVYTQLVPEITQEPDYQDVLNNS